MDTVKRVSDAVLRIKLKMGKDGGAYVVNKTKDSD